MHLQAAGNWNYFTKHCQMIQKMCRLSKIELNSLTVSVCLGIKQDIKTLVA